MFCFCVFIIHTCSAEAHYLSSFLVKIQKTCTATFRHVFRLDSGKRTFSQWTSPLSTREIYQKRWNFPFLCFLAPTGRHISIVKKQRFRDSVEQFFRAFGGSMMIGCNIQLWIQPFFHLHICMRFPAKNMLSLMLHPK